MGANASILRRVTWFGLAVLGAMLLGAGSAQASSTITRTSSWTYDPNTGLMTSETVEPNSTNPSITTTYTYDAFGNKLSATVSGTGIASRTTTTTYDSQGEFVTNVANALGQSETWTYDPGFGVPLSHTGPNGLTTTWVYDSLGRRTKESRADGTSTEWGYFYGQGNSSLGAYMVETLYLASDGSTQAAPTKIDLYDTLGRPIINYSQIYYGTTLSWTGVYTNYNASGQVYQKSPPVAATGVWTTYSYDALGRVAQVEAPNGGITAYGYNGLTTTVTDAQGNATTTTNNDMGLPVSATDVAGSTTTYTYDAVGDLLTIVDPKGNTTTYTYDNEGHKTEMVDPDRGSWSYAYDALGELTQQTDANANQTTFTYDLLGRMTQRDQPNQTDYWTYDTSPDGIGKLTNASSFNGATLISSRTLSYDTVGRPIATAIQTASSPSGTFQTAYDTSGRVSAVTYASGYTVLYSYNTIGTLASLASCASDIASCSNTSTNKTLWTLNTNNAAGQVTQETYGNGIVNNNTYDPNTGLLLATQAGINDISSQTNTVANFSYIYDSLGNLTSRADANEGLTEAFGYDNLYRLTSDTVNNNPAKTLQYDALGNITTKSDTGTYTYGDAAHPHAISSISCVTGTSCASIYNLNTSYTYDPNGNLLTGNNYTAVWTSFNMASSITQGTKNYTYAYDADHNRVSQTETSSGAPVGYTSYYNDSISGLRSEFLTTQPGGTTGTWTDYLSAGGALLGIHVTPVSSGAYNRYFIRDHLGSVAVLTDDNGNVVERDSYDAWGKRRNPDGTDDINNSIRSATTRGYTGHEMVQDIDLVNTNARMYDPMTGRFLSPDPLVQPSTNLQALNPYTYVFNNPLSATDPTGMKCHGWFGCTFGGWGMAIVAVAAVATFQYYVLPYLAGALATDGFTTAATIAGNGAVDAVLGGALGGAINSDFTWQGALIGAAEAGAFYGVGSATGGHFYESGIKGIGLTNGNETLVAWAESPQFEENIVGHGLVGGLASVAQGGKFESGFLAAGFADASGVGTGVAFPDTSSVNFGALVATSVSGGAASVAGGGNFANGAVTGAFGYLFNALGGKIVGGATGVAASAACDAATDGACAPADGEIVEGSANAGSALQDLISGSNLFKSAYNLVQYVRTGDFATAVKDFLSLGPDNVRPLPNPSQPGGLLGDLSDGSTVNVRPNSTFGPSNSPTMEIQTPDGQPDLKFRYNQ